MGEGGGMVRSESNYRDRPAPRSARPREVANLAYFAAAALMQNRADRLSAPHWRPHSAARPHGEAGLPIRLGPPRLLAEHVSPKRVEADDRIREDAADEFLNV